MVSQMSSNNIPTKGYFDFSVIDGTSRLNESYLLRYQIYCQQMGFLSSDNYPAELEKDKYDEHSIHIGGVNNDGFLVGSVRLVQSSPFGFPLQEHCALFDNYKRLFDKSAEELSHYAEISRLVVSKNFRRRVNDGLYGLGSPEDKIENSGGRKEARRRVRPEIVLGLYKNMYQTSKRKGITHWLAAMENTLMRVLGRFDFKFDPIGPQIDYYGPVIPFIAVVSDIEKRVAEHKPELFQEMIAGLEPEYLPDFAK